MFGKTIVLWAKHGVNSVHKVNTEINMALKNCNICASVTKSTLLFMPQITTCFRLSSSAGANKITCVIDCVGRFVL